MVLDNFNKVFARDMMFGKYEEDKQKGRIIFLLLRLVIGIVSFVATFFFAYLTGDTIRNGGSFYGVAWCFMMYKMFHLFSDVLFGTPSDARTFRRRLIGKG